MDRIIVIKELDKIKKIECNIFDIYLILKNRVLNNCEIGGYLNINNNNNNIVIIKSLSDYIKNTPCVRLYKINRDIIWHLHPYQNGINNNYPSLGDLKMSILNKNKVNIIFTKRKIYIYYYYPKDYYKYKNNNILNLEKWYNNVNKNKFIDDDNYNKFKINNLSKFTGINLVVFNYNEINKFWSILKKIYNKKWYII